MENLLVHDKQIVTPGTILTTDVASFRPGRGTIREQDAIISVFVGLVQIRSRFINVVPLNGVYLPTVGDKVIGIVYEKTPIKWLVDISSNYVGVLRPQNAMDREFKRQGRGRSQEEQEADEMDQFQVGDVLIAKVISFSRTTDPQITTLGKDLGKVNNGTLMSIPAPKIPRVIGRKGSMIRTLMDDTRCRIVVAQNGRIWLNGAPENVALAKFIIEKIHEEAHTSGLTDRIKEYIVEEKSKRGL
ncbi:MAG TPA: exosome complex RNA-binding protein Rrp4 [Candidatus Lokiarchaeia archaeon]|nr:exosome complex RNA-binding protein Rrp4 [Candidatus Lokiarchaeia archaeon]